MKDLKAISKNYFGKIKSSLGYKTRYGKAFAEYNEQYFTEMFDSRQNTHKQLIEFPKSKSDIKTVAEVGCSFGLYLKQFPQVFKNLQYTGYDINPNAIEFCRKNYDFMFQCVNFLKISVAKKFDFVFSMGVVDHVEDIDLFIRKIVEMSKKYAYINAYRGYFPDIEKYKMSWNDSDGVYYSDVSAKQVERLLLKLNLKSFEIMPSEFNDNEKRIETVIKITI